jgi:hypothetical protein
MNPPIEAEIVPQGAIAKHEPTGALSLESAFRAVVEGTIKQEHVAVMKELLAMDAERKFNTAFVELMGDIPKLVGCRGVPDRNGNIKFEYANFEDIDEIVRPICLRRGFCYSFKETGYGDGRVTTTMLLTHSGGHTREIPCTVRIGQGPPGTSEAQNDAGAHTYGKRGALEMALSLRIIGARDDAKMIGDESKKLTPDQATEIERRAKEVNANIPALLKFAAAASFAEIQASKYAELDAMLRRKESQGK